MVQPATPVVDGRACEGVANGLAVRTIHRLGGVYGGSSLAPRAAAGASTPLPLRRAVLLILSVLVASIGVALSAAGQARAQEFTDEPNDVVQLAPSSEPAIEGSTSVPMEPTSTDPVSERDLTEEDPTYATTPSESEPLDPAPADPVATDPVTTDPVTTDPPTTDVPVVPDEAATDVPVTTDPATTDPLPPDPVTTDPVATDPVTTDPVTTDPVPVDPVPADPVPEPQPTVPDQVVDTSPDETDVSPPPTTFPDASNATPGVTSDPVSNSSVPPAVVDDSHLGTTPSTEPAPASVRPPADPVPGPAASAAPMGVMPEPSPERSVADTPPAEPEADTAAPAPGHPASAEPNPPAPDPPAPDPPTSDSYTLLSAHDAPSSYTASPERPAADAVLSTEPDPSVTESVTARVARTVNDLLDALPDRIGGLLERTNTFMANMPERAAGLAGWMGEVAEVAGRLLGGGSPQRSDGSPLPARVPVAPPPPTPVPVGGLSFSGNSPSGGSGSSDGDLDLPIQHQFGVLDPFSFALSQGGGCTWLSREPLRPGSAARPPNERPG